MAVASPPEAAPADTAPQVVGFVCSTLTGSACLTHESMATHDPQGSLLCVHSVCVAEAARRRGVGSRLMRAYVNFVAQTSPDVTEIRLMCKEHLVSGRGGVAAVLRCPLTDGADSPAGQILRRRWV